MRLNPLFLSNLRRRQSGIYAQPEGITWESPYNMSATSGTTVISNRNFDCTDTGDTAGAIYATANGGSYEFYNCRFRSKAACVWSNYNINLKLVNCIGECVNPGVSGVFNRGFLHGKYTSLTVQRCTMKGGGMRVSVANPSTLLIEDNHAINIEGRYSDGAGGYLNTTPSLNVTRQFFQANGVTCGSVGNPALIQWNYVQNIPGQSHPGGDMISLTGGSSGLSTDPIKIRNNMLYGNNSYSPTTVTYSGRGIMLEDGTGGYIDIEDNLGARTPGLVAIDLDGHYSNVNIRRNKCYWSAHLDGTWLVLSTPPFGANASSTGTNQVWTDNEWWYWDGGYNSATFVGNAGNAGNSNTGWVEHFPLSEATEDAVPATWFALAAAAGRTQIGSTIAPWW